MTSKLPLVENKHRWLLGHVDVDYPTPESILGRDLYIGRELAIQYREWPLTQMEPLIGPLVDEVFLVDFHRMTVMFAQLQSWFWKDEKAQNHVLEFFAQIDLTDKHDLYVGFINGQPIICCIATWSANELLISDLVSKQPNEAVIVSFVQSVYSRYIGDKKVNKLIAPAV